MRTRGGSISIGAGTRRYYITVASSNINPDAHSVREFDHMHWGVEMARKGGVPPDRVLNAMPLAKLLRHLQRRRQTARHAA
jgi:DNA polymerase (family 10)